MSRPAMGVRPNIETFNRIEKQRREEIERTGFWRSGEEFTLDQVAGKLKLNASQARSFLDKGIKDGWVEKLSVPSGRRKYRKPPVSLLTIPWTKESLAGVLTPRTASV